MLTNVNIANGGLFVQRVQGEVLAVAGPGLPVPDGVSYFGELLK